MKYYHQLGRIAAACAALVLLLPAAQTSAAVIADPPSVVFTAPSQTARISLTADGVPVPSADVRAWRFLASSHDYHHMLRLDAVAGGVDITPSPTMEVGSYDLQIETAGGSVSVRVVASLSEVPDIVERTAQLTGQSERQIEERMGLLTPIRRESVQIALPPVFYEGETLNVSVANTPVAGRNYVWFLNGAVVAEGPDKNRLVHTFNEPGEFVLTYIETEISDGKVVAVARTSAHTRVVPVPPVPTDVAAGTKVEFLPPSGYQSHGWGIDGTSVSSEPVLRHVFNTPGNYVVECLATAPVDPAAQQFMRIRYNVTVR